MQEDCRSSESSVYMLSELSAIIAFAAEVRRMARLQLQLSILPIPMPMPTAQPLSSLAIAMQSALGMLC